MRRRTAGQIEDVSVSAVRFTLYTMLHGKRMDTPRWRPRIDTPRWFYRHGRFYTHPCLWGLVWAGCSHDHDHGERVKNTRRIRLYQRPVFHAGQHGAVALLAQFLRWTCDA